MPNHCENDLYIQGNKQPREILKAIKSLTEEDYLFYFNRVIPMPESLLNITSPQQNEKEIAQAKENLKLYGATDWYTWSCKNWGTKWNAYDIVIRYRKPKSIKIKFETAWAPPLPVITALAKKFPAYTFTLRYFERGMAYQGTLKIKGDRILKQEQKKYRGRRGG